MEVAPVQVLHHDAIRVWTLTQIPGGASDLDQLVCNGETLRGSINPTAGGGSKFIAQVTLNSAALGLAISQACYATGENHQRAVLKQLMGQLDLEGVLLQADALHAQQPFFDSSRSRMPTSSFLTVKANQKILHRQIRSQFQEKRHIPFVATGQEKSHDRDITWKLRARRQAPEHISKIWISTTWIIEVIATGSRDGKPFQATHH